MRDEANLLPAGFGGADIHVAIYLPTVSADYLSIEFLRQTKSQTALADSGGSNDSYQVVHLLVFLATTNFCGLFYNTYKLLCLQAGAADKSTIYLWLPDEFSNIFGGNAATIEYARIIGNFFII